MVDCHPPSSALRLRHGFSLLEMLVALSIAAIVLGLTIGGLVRGRDSNRLLAAEHLIGDFIRQARHAARSSGAPVELRLRPVIDGSQVVGTTIAGVSRVPIWSERFDTPGLIIGAPGTDIDTNLLTIGRSGNGRRVDPTHTIQQPLTAREQLVRGGRSDGFYLSCAVLPPVVGSSGAIQPLLLIGAGNDQLDASQCGLSLQVANPQRSIHPGTAALPSWEILGWVRSGSTLVYVSSFDNPPTDVGADQQVLPSGDLDVASPLVGGTWVELGLLYDGERLVLYRDGQRVGETMQQGAVRVPKTLETGTRIFVGQATIFDTQVPPGAVQTFSAVAFDDLRLERLGTDQLGQLPRGVVLSDGTTGRANPALSYRIIANPDGRVEVFQDGDLTESALNDRPTTTPIPAAPGRAKPAVITVMQRLTGAALYSAAISISIDGHVTSALVTKQRTP